MFDIIIRNGVIIDGSGEKMHLVDIGIKDDEIAEIGELHNERGEVEINARRKYVCPGFIDVNNHSDTYWQIFNDPNLESLVHQGITTIVGGNCGSSLAPLVNAKTLDTIQKWANIRHISINWLDFDEFFKFLETKRISVNFASLVGHATLRRGIIKDKMRALETNELAIAGKMLKNSIQEGALGMSTGLIYTHARSATMEELVYLANILKKYNGVYVSHIRNEGKNLVEAAKEAINLAEKTGVKIHISHLKAVGEKYWHLMDEVLFAISKAKEQGLDITFDVFPYTQTGTVLYTMLPEWVSEGGKKMMLHRLRDQAIQNKVMEEMKNSDIDFSKVEIAISSLSKTLSKRKITEIATSQNKSVEKAVIDVLIASDGRVITNSEVLSEDNIKKAIVHPLSIIASNGTGYCADHRKTGELVHPRCFGTFPKILVKYVSEQKLLKWEEAIRKMTALPAEKFGLRRRGKLKENYFADIVIIDPKKIKDQATVENPYQYNKGIDWVITNGKITIKEGEYTQVRNGEVIIR